MIELSNKCPECGEYGTMELVWSDTKVNGFDQYTGWDIEPAEIKEKCTECGFTQIKDYE
ncbi:MAG: hypothetical protein ACQETL_19080 [Bacteroidota bacterium]